MKINFLEVQAMAIIALVLIFVVSQYVVHKEKKQATRLVKIIKNTERF